VATAKRQRTVVAVVPSRAHGTCAWDRCPRKQVIVPTSTVWTVVVKCYERDKWVRDIWWHLDCYEKAGSPNGDPSIDRRRELDAKRRAAARRGRQYRRSRDDLE